MQPIPQVSKHRRWAPVSKFRASDLSWTHVSIKASQKQEQHLPSYIIVLGLETHLLPFGNTPRVIFYCLYLSPAKALNKVVEEEKEEGMTIQPMGFSIPWGRDSWRPKLWYLSYTSPEHHLHPLLQLCFEESNVCGYISWKVQYSRFFNNVCCMKAYKTTASKRPM